MFQPRVILYFLCLLALISHGLGLADRETESHPRLKQVNLNIILIWSVTSLLGENLPILMQNYKATFI